jgi:hypothetical protein
LEDNPPTVPTESSVPADIEQAMEALNHSPLTQLFGSRSLISSVRCFAGRSQDFPDSVLFTVIGSNGSWVQASVGPGGLVDMSSFTQGEDYRAAGIDPAAFLANGYECYVSYQNPQGLSFDPADAGSPEMPNPHPTRR